ncbi:MAG: bifunctional (p)ppGpp synthetase/guanosine-3',5'-bis(diphosphate) 3'-pyrophosphohydrolase [Pseudomonadota bacterium]
MIPVEALIDHVRTYNPQSNAELIERAYNFAKEKHEGQVRHSGEPYFTHPIEVALILTAQRLDDATIITALLHDTLEDTGASEAEIESLFGPDVTALVDGVTKLTNLELSSKELKQAENIRKLVLAMSKDLRVVLVKLGDRLHNMRTIQAMTREKQMLKARETMDIFAPLAGRMGMQWMRDELEDLSFQVLNPEARTSIIRRFITLKKQTDDVIPKIKEDIQHLMYNARITARVFGREKKPFSIWRKMSEKNESFSRLSDIYGFRVITETEEDCYRALGLVHRRWAAVPGRFKDYISQPKTNGYRSIHTTVISGHEARRVEVQIRTAQMHEVAEAGVAAHWAYRDGERESNPFSFDAQAWLSNLAETLATAEDTENLIEHMKLEMFSDQVFCFTPKGEVVKLPRGATPIDFAYAIHSKIGGSCAGAKVDGKRVPLWTRLRNGQSVEIIRAEGQRPQKVWLDSVTTGRAKAAIRKALREDHRESYIRLGRELARLAFENVRKRATDKALTTAAKALGLANTDELLARLGSAELTGTEVVSAIYPELLTKTDKKSGDGGGKIVGLTAEQVSRNASCCQPLPGERIVGIAAKGSGVMVHAINCPTLVEFENETDRWIDLTWSEGTSERTHPVTVELTIRNDAGVLGRVCTLIGETRANISDLEFADRRQDFYRIVIDLDVLDITHLHTVLTALEAEADVAQIRRIGRGSVDSAH